MSYVDDRIDELIGYYKKLDGYMVYYQAEFNKAIKRLEELKSWDDALSEQEKKQQLYKIISNIYYSTMKQSIYFTEDLREALLISDFYTQDERNQIKKKFADEIISITCDENKIHIILPLLYKKNRSYESPYYYNEELRIKLKELLSQGRLPHYRNKHIYFINVYSSSESKMKIMDNDNFDTKNIIDIICDNISYGDSALTTTLTFSSIVSNTLISGTHIIVTEMKDILNDLSIK